METEVTQEQMVAILYLAVLLQLVAVAAVHLAQVLVL
jgi:hypothetical protein